VTDSIRLLAACLLLAPACVGRGGPDLPDNIGQTHPEGAGHQRVEREPEPEPEPVAVGATVWGDFRGTGFLFYGVVVERRDADYRVIYADGTSEWVRAGALRPDSLRTDTEVHVRPTVGGEFAEGTVGRRLGDAVYVHFAGGVERWTNLAHVRVREGDPTAPRRGDEPVSPRPTGIAPGANVLVDYHRAGLRFAAVVTAVGDDARIHVVYLDGETEWVAPEHVVPEELAVGDAVHVRRRWEPAEWVRGRIVARQQHAVQIELDDGGLAWTSVLRLRTAVATTTEAPEPAEVVDAAADETDP